MVVENSGNPEAEIEDMDNKTKNSDLSQESEPGIRGTVSGTRSFQVGRTRTLRLKTQQQLQQTTRNNNNNREGILTGPQLPLDLRLKSFGQEDDLWTNSDADSSTLQKQTSLSSTSALTLSSNTFARKRRRTQFRPVHQRHRQEQLNPQLETNSFHLTCSDDDSVTENTEKRSDHNDNSSVSRSGVVTNVYELQNRGHWQLLADEVAYLCDGILQAEGTPSDPAFDASLLELAWFVSFEKNRQVFRQNQQESNVPLTTILDLIAQLSDKTQMTPILSLTLHILWHFLSFDCTTNIMAELARALRWQILSHQLALAGLIQLSLLPDNGDDRDNDGKQDHGQKRPRQQLPQLGRRAKASEATLSFSQTTSLGSLSDTMSPPRPPSSLDTFSQQQHYSPQSSVSADPTVAGRKRRRMRPEQQIPMKQQQQRETRTKGDFSFASSLSTTGSAGNHFHSDASTRKAVQQEQWSTILKRVMATIGGDAYGPNRTNDADITIFDFRAGERTQVSLSNHKLKADNNSGGINLPPNLALRALQRILTGRFEGHDKSCLDDSSSDRHKAEIGMRRDADNTINKEDDDGDEESVSNPLIATNRLLANQEKTIFLLALAMGQAVDEATTALANGHSCTGAMQERIAILASIIDGACLFHSENRHEFVCCLGDGDDESNWTGSLIAHLISFLQVLLNVSLNCDDGPMSLFCGTTTTIYSWGCSVGLEVIKMLTSLTHENESSILEMTNVHGWEVLAQLLFNHAVVTGRHDRHDDLAIFALNTLANLVESSSPLSSSLVTEPKMLGQPLALLEDGKAIAVLETLKVANVYEGKPKSVLFLPWLVKHLVSLTECFREELLGECRIDSSKAKERTPLQSTQLLFLEERENDNLLLAGNGFVLVAYLLVGNNHNHNSLEGIILEHLPGMTYPLKIQFLQRALKAFCNFYRHTVGELSLAITAPVQLLLNSLQQMVQKPRN